MVVVTQICDIYCYVNLCSLSYFSLDLFIYLFINTLIIDDGDTNLHYCA
jgi:hypothetical protein